MSSWGSLQLLVGMPSWQEWLIILLIVIVIFGGSKIAGLGKASGKAIREFKEELKGSDSDKDETTQNQTAPAPPAPAQSAPADQAPSASADAATTPEPGKADVN